MLVRTGRTESGRTLCQTAEDVGRKERRRRTSGAAEAVSRRIIGLRSDGGRCGNPMRAVCGVGRRGKPFRGKADSVGRIPCSEIFIVRGGRVFGKTFSRKFPGRRDSEKQMVAESSDSP